MTTKIIDFLILSSICPRSIFFAVEKINHHVYRLCEFYEDKNIVHKKVNTIYKGLSSCNAEQIINFGLHEFLTKFIDDIGNVYSDLEKVYFSGLNR